MHPDAEGADLLITNVLLDGNGKSQMASSQSETAIRIARKRGPGAGLFTSMHISTDVR